MLIMGLVPILSALSGWLLFGEQIVGWEYAGIGLALGGVAWVVTDRQDADRQTDAKRFKRGVLLALGGALGQTANLVFSKYALVDGYSALSATLIRILVGVVVLWGWTVARRDFGRTVARLRSDRRALATIAGGSFVGPFLGIWFSLIAIQAARIGIASTIMALPPVLLIPLTAVIFRERISRRAVAGTLVAIGGVALLFLVAPA
jgi:drug/metabolite transporter (DMT)-like permease